MAEAKLFVSEQNPTSQRWAIVEEGGEATYLYLTLPGNSKPVADAFLFSKVILESVEDVQRIAESGMAPPILRKFAVPVALREFVVEPQISFKWSPDGEGVIVAVDGNPIAAIVGGSSYSKSVAVQGPWGLPWEEAVLNGF